MSNHELPDKPDATRAVQREPTNDREVLAEKFREYLGDSVYVCSRDASAWQYGTMALEDFEVLASEDENTIDSLVDIALSRAGVPDAATAAIARVRAIHYPIPTAPHIEGKQMCADPDCNDGFYPCKTRVALDGAPEPEWEYVGLAFEHGGFMRVRRDNLKPEKFEQWLKLMQQYPRVEIWKRVPGVKPGPWLPAEGE